MRLYRFSPIKSEETCRRALEHIQSELRKLSGQVLKERLPINTLKLFAHYDDEYSFLKKWVDGLGASDDEGSGSSYYVKPYQSMTVNGEPIEYLGIRVPDPYRAQVGGGDFVVNNFEEFKRSYLGKTKYVREVAHPRYEMLELFHPDSDVLGYIVKE